MKQTTVQWLVNKINNDFENNDFLINYANEINQALEIEKQQIIDAYIEGYSATDYNVDSEQYYNETFKTK